MDICVLKRDDGDRLIGPPIIELVLDKRHSEHLYNQKNRKHSTKNEDKREENISGNREGENR